MSQVSINATAYVVNEQTIKIQSSSVLLVKLEGTVLMGACWHALPVYYCFYGHAARYSCYGTSSVDQV